MPRNKPKKDTSERWMISYADLLTLMLAFFIVLYSQSMNDVSRLKEIARGMTEAFNGKPDVVKQEKTGSSGILEHQKSPIKKPVPRPTTSAPRAPLSEDLRRRVDALDTTERELRDVLAPLLDDKQVSMARHPLSLRVRLNSTILFPSASANLTHDAKPLLTRIGDVLKKLPDDFPLVIQGYTDKRPINTREFSSNWELSTARAVSVVQLFRNRSFPGQQLSAEGFSKFHPLNEGNNTTDMQANRRVEILIKAPSAKSLDTRTGLSRIESFARFRNPDQTGSPDQPLTDLAGTDAGDDNAQASAPETRRQADSGHPSAPGAEQTETGT